MMLKNLLTQSNNFGPTTSETLVLQVEIHRIRKEIDQATDLIQMFVNRPDATPQVLEVLAESRREDGTIPNLPSNALSMSVQAR